MTITNGTRVRTPLGEGAVWVPNPRGIAPNPATGVKRNPYEYAVDQGLTTAPRPQGDYALVELDDGGPGFDDIAVFPIDDVEVIR